MLLKQTLYLFELAETKNIELLVTQQRRLFAPDASGDKQLLVEIDTVLFPEVLSVEVYKVFLFPKRFQLALGMLLFLRRGFGQRYLLVVDRLVG